MLFLHILLFLSRLFDFILHMDAFRNY